MEDNNSLIDLLIKKCESKNILLYDSNLINELRKMSNREIIEYLILEDKGEV